METMNTDVRVLIISGGRQRILEVSKMDIFSVPVPSSLQECKWVLVFIKETWQNAECVGGGTCVGLTYYPGRVKVHKAKEIRE